MGQSFFVGLHDQSESPETRVTLTANRSLPVFPGYCCKSLLGVTNEIF
jgi:hypothetical protein